MHAGKHTCRTKSGKGASVEKKASEVAAIGGDARARKLSVAKRRAIAQTAAATRWATAEGSQIPRAIRAAPLHIGEIEFECAVLDDATHTRVVSETNFMEAMGMYRSGALSTRRPRGDGKSAHIPLSLAYKNLKPYVERHLDAVHFSPLRYFTPQGNLVTVGLPATIIPKICEVWIDADRDGKLARFPRQQLIAKRADILHRGLAQVGIIALIDEVTGWQEDRERDALARILEAFVNTELRKWVKTFPLDYYRQLCRLKGHPFPVGSMRLPSYFGHLTNDLVYARLAPGVLAELRRKNPAVKPGRRKHKHFQWLTEEVGDPRLREHLWSVITLMKASDDWDGFYAMVERALPKYSNLPLLAMIEQPNDASASAQNVPAEPEGRQAL
jgi:hypothetical protein